MVKSFLNAFFGGIGRTLGRIVVYILIALIFFFIYENANAEEININSSVYGTTGYNNMYYGQNYYNGSLSGSNFSLNTRYTGRLKSFTLDIRRSFTANTIYNLYVYAATTDFRNNLQEVVIDDITNTSSCTIITAQFISKTKLKASFVCGHNTSRIDVHWYANETSYLTGDTNFNIKNVTLELENTSGSNNDDIINSATQNTEDIINNNNSNTQDIIDNQKQNAQEIIDNQNFNSITELNSLRKTANADCLNFYDIPLKYDYYNLSSSGELVSSTIKSYYTEQFIHIDFVNSSYGSRIILVNPVQSVSGYRFIFYDNNFNFISATPTASRGINIPSNASYFRFSSPVANTYVFRGSACVRGTDIINNSINDSSDADTSIFSTWWSNFNPLSNPIGEVITLPITLAQKIVGFTSTSCSAVNLGALFGTSLILPCFSLSSVLPNNASTLITTIDVIMSISLLVVIIKNTYETIANLISLGGENKVKSHFRLPTPLEFMSSLLNGNGYAEYVDYR